MELRDRRNRLKEQKKKILLSLNLVNAKLNFTPMGIGLSMERAAIIPEKSSIIFEIFVLPGTLIEP